MSRPLEDVQDEILDRIHAGETVDREALLAAHPEHVEALTAFFEVLAVVEGSTGEGPELARLGEFRILCELGRGGMGRVYEAEQTSLKRRVALKVLPPTLRLDGRLVSRFRREAEAAGRLRHPGIVPVFSVGEAAGTPFFAMELVDGASLHAVLEKRRAGEDAGLPVDPDGWRRWAVETAAKVADALAYAHEHGILHRDVKPANILLGESGEPRLTDFGLALDLRAPEITQTGEVFGSPMYMSPEQALRRDAPIDERTDVYSLAVTLYELLTLRLPYDGTTSAEVLTALVSGKVVPPRKVDPSMPRALEQVLLGALIRDPKGRYRNAAAFAADLRATLQGSAPTRAPAAPLGRRLRVPIAVLAAVTLVALGIALWQGRGEERAPQAATSRIGEEARDVPAQDPVDETLVARLMQELTVLGPAATAEDFEAAFSRLRGIDSPVARDALRMLQEAYVAGPGGDDPEARRALGYRFFAHEVPEVVSFRGYPYVQAVERAAAKRWFGPGEDAEYALAEEAWEETLQHAQRLLSNRIFRAEDRVRAQIGMNPRTAAYHVTTRWADPFLLCHLGSEPASKYDAVARSEDAGALLARLAERREGIERRLDRTGVLLTALHGEFTRRFGAALGLKPLMAAWGGRPDLPPGVRSFEDGAPLVVLLAESREAFEGASRSLVGGPLPPGIGAVFVPMTGSLYSFVDEPGGIDAETEQAKLLHDAVHQLQFWYFRQRNAWRTGPVGQGWYDEGLAECLSAVETGAGGELRFTGLNRLRLREMQSTGRALKARDRAYPLFSIEQLTSIRTYRGGQQLAAAEFDLPPTAGMGLLFQQGWAFVFFLTQADDGRYRKGFARFLDVAFSAEGRWESGPDELFEALGLTTEAARTALENAYRAFVVDHLLEIRSER